MLKKFIHSRKKLGGPELKLGGPGPPLAPGLQWCSETNGAWGENPRAPAP